MKKTTAMMALLLTIYAAVFFYGCTNKSSYSNSDDAYINYATDMQLMYHIGGNAPMTKSDKGYYYNVMDGTNVIGGFKLESVTPTNVMTKGEYLIKRVSSNAAVSAVTYFGLEAKDAGNKATNYVVCPWTKNRTGLTLAEAEGPTSLYNVKKTTSTSTVVGEASYILDYVMENTTTDNAETYSTGLIFKGKYYEETEWDKTTMRPTTGAPGTDK